MQSYIEDMSLQEAIKFLVQHLLIYEPEEFVVGHITTVRDIYHHRSALKTFTGTDQIVSHVAGIIIQAIDNHQRMRTLDCLKVLRALVKQGSPEVFQPNTIEKLFRIYREFIFRDNDEVQWCVSAILKDKPLSDEAVDWLLKNASESEHIVNRLLLYPTHHPKIVSWAQQVYDDNSLPNRRSEIIALLLSDRDADALAAGNDPNSFLWGVFKSHLPREDKIRLVERHCSFQAFASVVEIADRLSSPGVLQMFLQKLKEEQEANNPLEVTAKTAPQR